MVIEEQLDSFRHVRIDEEVNEEESKEAEYLEYVSEENGKPQEVRLVANPSYGSRKTSPGPTRPEHTIRKPKQFTYVTACNPSYVQVVQNLSW